MKNKKLWIMLFAFGVLAPTVILCVLMANSREFSLENFAESSYLTVTDTQEKTVSLKKGEDYFVLLTKILSLAQEQKTKANTQLTAPLYIVKDQSGDHTCSLGIENGQVAVEWKESVYILSYPHLKSSDTDMYPRLVRYGVEVNSGYLDAPILSQKADFVYFLRSSDDLLNVSFEGTCQEVSVEILLYEQGSDRVFQKFYAFQDLVFDESKEWSIIVNAEVKQNGYRVQCGYEFIFAPSSEK